MSKPILSIITVNLNNNEGLKKTIDSLKEQEFYSYEHIIIDGGSTDGSVDTIIQYSHKTNKLSFWTSEPDKGIYDGMNKGLEYAKGDYFYFLNSGDCLTHNILCSIPFDGTQYIYGDIRFIPENGKSWIWAYPDVFDTFFISNENGWISQQACFIHNSVFQDRKYDTNYKIIADWIHTVQSIIIEGCSYKHLHLIIADYDGSGVSNANQEKTWSERNKWIKENIPAIFFIDFKELNTFRQIGLTKDIIYFLEQKRKFRKQAKKLITVLYHIMSYLNNRHKKNKEKILNPSFKVLYDYQIFEMQRFGGISRYFSEIIHRLTCQYEIAIKFSMNHYLANWHLGNNYIPLPRFIYKLWSPFFKKRNHRLASKLLTNSENYLFHPTYYDPYFLKHIRKQPYVITVHDMIHERFPQLVTDSQIQITRKKEVISKANRIIAISENTKKDIIEILGIAPEKIDVIYHGTSMQPFSGKYKLKLPNNFLLFIGDRTPYKNFQRFMEAFADIHEIEPDLYVVYTGKPLDENEISQLKSMKILNYTIHIKASDKTLSELYSRATLFVYPSLYEGFGIPILEAYACHCPIAISNTSCFPEIAGDAAIYFDPYSKESIREAITEALRNEERRNDLIQLGDIRLKHYSWEEATRKTQETYQKIIDSIT